MKTPVQNENRGPAKEKSAEAARYLVPAVDIHETGDGYLLVADMPGVDNKSLEITVDGNDLGLLGRRRTGVDQHEARYRESSPLAFRRVFELDPSVDVGKVSARMEDGVLTLRLPKAEKHQPRKIVVTS
jgi:HSP20 family protein